MQAVALSSAAKTRSLAPWVWYGLTALPVLYYIVMVALHAYNMPYMDDYPSIVDLLLRWQDADWSERGRLLLEQNNFHRVVFLKLISLANYALTGAVNFTFLQWVGNVAWLMIGWLLWRSLAPVPDESTDPSDRRSPVKRILTFLPAVYFLFQFQFWNNAFWSMAAICNLWVHAWALLSFYLAARQRIGWALAAGALSLFTVGNGIVVLPLLIAGLLLNRQWRQATVAVVVSAVLYAVYFSNYQNPSSAGLSSLLSVERIIHFVQLDTAFLGATFYHPSVAWLSQVVGWLTIGWSLYLVITRYDRQNPTLFWMVIFLHLTGLMLALNRIENSVDVVFASRYRQVPALMLAVTYLTFADVLISKRVVAWTWIFPLTLAAAVGINVVSNVTYFSKIVRFRELKQTDQLLWQRYGIVRGCSPLYQPAQRLSQLAASGAFRPAPLTLDELVSQEVSLPQPTPTASRLSHQIDLNRQDGSYLVVSGFAKITGQKANFNDTYLAVQTPGGWRFFTTLFHQRLDKEDSLNDKDTGFTAVVPASVAGSSPKLGLFVRSGGKTAFQVIN
ncbi:hypothetical protein DYU11_02020 [Fibrisoma montanum]|uniref:Uncharacterized protein n=1 Tax=Fibrisoma montanum TaxID=2305895 RepID=A0A418MI74_9BACT|nr:hypothetical protein [Fibrisoma montanum]RIV27116.1 hypothetical protein DYU11_02020 [Fibrisoma montanum]